MSKFPSTNPPQISLSGSNVTQNVVLADITAPYTEFTTGFIYEWFGANGYQQSNATTDVIDISKYKSMGVYVNNTTNVAMQMSVVLYSAVGKANADSIATPVNTVSLAAGASTYYEPSTYSELKSPALGIAVFAYNQGAASSGNLEVRIIGGEVN